MVKYNNSRRGLAASVAASVSLIAALRIDCIIAQRPAHQWQNGAAWAVAKQTLFFNTLKKNPEHRPGRLSRGQCHFWQTSSGIVTIASVAIGMFSITLSQSVECTACMGVALNDVLSNHDLQRVLKQSDHRIAICYQAF